MRIAICDDEKIFCEIICEKCEKILAEMNLPYEIDTFCDGTMLLATENTPEILFLDIEMPIVDGFEIAEQFYRDNPDTFIIFVTSHEEMIRRAFRVRAYRFLEKPVRENEVKEALLAAMHEMERQKFLMIREENSAVRLRYDDILYVESLGDGCAIHLRDRYYITSDSLRYYSKILCMPDFFQVSRTHIVSFEHVTRLDEKKVYLDSNEAISISRRMKKLCKQAYIDYIKMRMV